MLQIYPSSKQKIQSIQSIDTKDTKNKRYNQYNQKIQSIQSIKIQHHWDSEKATSNFNWRRHKRCSNFTTCASPVGQRLSPSVRRDPCLSKSCAIWKTSGSTLQSCHSLYRSSRDSCGSSRMRGHQGRARHLTLSSPSALKILCHHRWPYMQINITQIKISIDICRKMARNAKIHATNSVFNLESTFI